VSHRILGTQGPCVRMVVVMVVTRGNPHSLQEGIVFGILRSAIHHGCTRTLTV
jgi:hypothetical protein